MAHPDANIIWGVQLDENLEDTVRITVVATGLGKEKKKTDSSFVDILSTETEGEDDGTYSELFDMINNRK